METGFEMDKRGKPKASKGLIDSLPIRGGERVDIIMEDKFYTEGLELDDFFLILRDKSLSMWTQFLKDKI